MLPFSGLMLPKGYGRLAALTIGGAYSSEDGAPGTANIILRFLTNGTWDRVGGSGDTVSGTPASATWLPAGALASDYKVKFTVTAGPSGVGVVTNGASSFQAITTTRLIDLSLSGGGADTDSITVTVDLQRVDDATDTVQDTGIGMTAELT